MTASGSESRRPAAAVSPAAPSPMIRYRLRAIARPRKHHVAEHDTPFLLCNPSEAWWAPVRRNSVMGFVVIARASALIACGALLSACPKKDSEAAPEPAGPDAAAQTPGASDQAGGE